MLGTNGLALSTTDDQVFLLGSLPAPLVPTITLSLTGCSDPCRPGDTFSVSATVVNAGLQAVPVEVKAGVGMPDGATMSAWVGGSIHYETTLPPGMNQTVELIRVSLPAGLQPGDWLYEVVLLTPDLGRTVTRDARPFTVGSPGS